MLNAQYVTPGVYTEDVFQTPIAELQTGVPAFLGYASRADKIAANMPQLLTRWSQFEEYFGPPRPDSYLSAAVQGFFENEGQLCYVVRLDDNAADAIQALNAGLQTLAILNTIDLVCAPDIMRPRPANPKPDSDEVHVMQAAVMEHCDSLGDRFAILDPEPSANVDEVVRQQSKLTGTNGALYFPWIQVQVPRRVGSDANFIPPCGHVAGVYARTDQRIGVHKAPANDNLEGVLDLAINLTNADQARLNPSSINCLRAFPGRGIRVWGARTLSADPNWTYINVRRLFLTAGRWVERNMASTVFEPSDARLWARVTRELSAYFNRLYQHGALKGHTAQEAFYVKCDAETNPPEAREAGQLITEIGLAPARPTEFVVVRIIHGASGVTINGPSRP